MKKTFFYLFLAVGLCGCKTTSSPVSHAAFTAAVTLGTQYGIETHPEALPYIRAATPVVCAVANGTNFSPAAVVAALDRSGLTNASAKLIINGSLAILNVVVIAVGPTNQTEIAAYGKDLCNGLTAAIPSNGSVAARRSKLARLTTPHLLP